MGSCLFELGDTRVLCARTWTRRSPSGDGGAGSGGSRRSTPCCPPRPTSAPAGVGNRRQGAHVRDPAPHRPLAAVGDRPGGLGGEVTVNVDCDVIQADGGTRTAAITGAYLAVYDALSTWRDAGKISDLPLLDFVAATSVGMVDGVALLDLDYSEDSIAEIDMNIVMDGRGASSKCRERGADAIRPCPARSAHRSGRQRGRSAHRRATPRHRRERRCLRALSVSGFTAASGPHEAVVEPLRQTRRVATRNAGKLARSGCAALPALAVRVFRELGDCRTGGNRVHVRGERAYQAVAHASGSLSQLWRTIWARGRRPRWRAGSVLVALQRRVATDARNNARLLTALANTPLEERTARFRCVMVFIDESGCEVVASGACEARSASSARCRRLGYDPLFWPDATPVARWPSSRLPRRTRSRTGCCAARPQELIERSA